jgi:hypothetical protein
MTLMMAMAAVAAGYVLAIYTWTPVRTWMTGAEQELASLRARSAALEAKLRVTFGKSK